jgi:hypothetical protein
MGNESIVDSLSAKLVICRLFSHRMAPASPALATCYADKTNSSQLREPIAPPSRNIEQHERKRHASHARPVELAHPCLYAGGHGCVNRQRKVLRCRFT